MVRHCWLLVQGEEVAEKTAKDYYWIGELLTCSVSHEVIVKALFNRTYLKDKLGLCSINCHIYEMNGNSSTSSRVLANSLLVVPAMTRNPPLLG